MKCFRLNDIVTQLSNDMFRVNMIWECCMSSQKRNEFVNTFWEIWDACSDHLDIRFRSSILTLNASIIQNHRCKTFQHVNFQNYEWQDTSNTNFYHFPSCASCVSTMVHHQIVNLIFHKQHDCSISSLWFTISNIHSIFNLCHQIFKTPNYVRYSHELTNFDHIVVISIIIAKQILTPDMNTRGWIWWPSRTVVAIVQLSWSSARVHPHLFF